MLDSDGFEDIQKTYEQLKRSQERTQAPSPRSPEMQHHQNILPTGNHKGKPSKPGDFEQEEAIIVELLARHTKFDRKKGSLDDYEIV